MDVCRFSTPVDSPLDGGSRGHQAQLRVAAMMLNGNGAVGGHQQPTTSAQNGGQQNPQAIDPNRRRVTAPPNYSVHPPRLPESPPETDSGAGSAGSPSSSSEQSPYSPDFNPYGKCRKSARARLFSSERDAFWQLRRAIKAQFRL